MKQAIARLLAQWASANVDDGKSDVYKYAGLFRGFVAECPHITEFGVRDGVSTAAFLSGLPKVMRCYDLEKSENIGMLEEVAGEDGLGVDFKFLREDTRFAQIEETDLLFIDSLHQYSTIKKELDGSADRVRKYIVFHDTTKFWEYEPNNPCYVEGIGRAIQELLAGGGWEVVARYREGCGLMVIRRK